MKKYVIISNILIWFGVCIPACGQQLLTLSNAVAQALENNLDIQIESFESQKAHNNVSRAISGQMPQVAIDMSGEVGYSNAETEVLGFGPGDAAQPPLSLDGTAYSLTAKPQLSIPLFNGFRGRYTYKKLEMASEMATLQMEDVTEGIVQQTVEAYLQAARLQEKLLIDRENIRISTDRLARTTANTVLGKGTTLNRLQAEVSLKTDSSTYMHTALQYATAKRSLCRIIGSAPNIDFEVEQEVTLSEKLNYDTLGQRMQTQNTLILLTEKNTIQAQYDIMLSRASRMPNLQAYANYSYLRTKDEANFLQRSTVYGPNTGVRLNIPIFTGGEQKISQQNAKISRQQADVRLNDTKTRLETDLANTFGQYENSLSQWRIAQSNLPTYQANYDKATSDFALGQVTATELRTAQLDLAEAKYRANNLKYDVKQYEIRLLRLSGGL